MKKITKLDPTTSAARLEAGEAVLIDIREPDEYAREHIPGAISLPISVLDVAGLTLEAGRDAIFHCRSGRRTDENCALLAQHVEGDVLVMEGGLDAWRALGLPISKDVKAPLEMNRQVQITAGFLILLGVVLGWFIHPALFGLAAFVGVGLMFAGISGWCGMANLLAVMPWNARKTAQ